MQKLSPAHASLINAITLILMGLWGFVADDEHSNTALIPVGCGVLLLALYYWVKKENKVIAHIAVVLTLFIMIALFYPFHSAINRGSVFGCIRVGLMIATCILAMGIFVKSFIDARKNRQ